jgi:hypothetical protein
MHEVKFMELIWITAAKVLDGYKLHLTFNNGACKVYDFANLLAKGQPVFAPPEEPCCLPQFHSRRMDRNLAGRFN